MVLVREMYYIFFVNDQAKTQFVSLCNFELKDVAILGLIQSSEVVEQLKKNTNSLVRVFGILYFRQSLLMKVLAD